MEVSNPAWRAPLHKGDRIRISGTYENKDHGWYDVMTHEGFYIDEAQPPAGRCAPELIDKPTRGRKIKRRHVVKKRQEAPGAPRRASTAGRAHGNHRHIHIKKASSSGKAPPRRAHAGRSGAAAQTASSASPPAASHPPQARGQCGPDRGRAQPALRAPPRPLLRRELGGQPCDRPETDRGTGIETSNAVTIANFLYAPGDHTLAGQQGAPARVKQGHRLTFVNADQEAGIRHTVTTCQWPCNGRYVGNYPLPDGDLGLGHAGLRRDRRRHPPTRWRPRPTQPAGGQVRLLLPHPPVDARRFRSRRLTRQSICDR